MMLSLSLSLYVLRDNAVSKPARFRDPVTLAWEQVCPTLVLSQHNTDRVLVLAKSSGNGSVSGRF